MKTSHDHYSRKLFEINANWTHLTGIQGWRHYRVAAIRHSSSQTERECEMMSVCDRKVRFWLRRSELKQDPEWQPGWLP